MVSFNKLLLTALQLAALCTLEVSARNGRQIARDIEPRWFWNLDVAKPQVYTLDGFVLGHKASDAVNRFTVPYAKPPTGSLRFQHPEPIKSWSSWKDPLDASELKSACPNLGGPVPSTNEDCLYLNIYAPSGVNFGLSTMVWLHGGSRSAIDPGLDGSTLAEQENIIVVTVEYRGGLFGFLKNDELGAPGNQGLLDIITALKWLQKNIIFFGGNPLEVTLAGQSTGGSLLKTLLATPSADWLFARGIIQSAPFNYGDHSVDTGNALGHLLANITECSTLDCLQSASVSDLLNDEQTAIAEATAYGGDEYIPGVGTGEPFRPFVDGDLVKGNLFNGNIRLTRKSRTFMITGTEDEAAADISAISAGFSADGATPTPIPSAYFDYVVSSLLVPEFRSNAVLASGLYEPGSGDDATREQLTILGTDYIWRCAEQQAAVNITAARQSKGIYYGAFEVGITYATNQGLDLCEGKVCHEDDILLVFGNTLESQTLSLAQQSVQKEVMARWGGFVKNGRPQAQGYDEWKSVQDGAHLNLLSLGSKSEGEISDASQSLSQTQQTYHAEACGPNALWGNVVPFDVTLYGP